LWSLHTLHVFELTEIQNIAAIFT